MKTLGIDPGTTRIGYGIIENDLVVDYGLINGKNSLEIIHQEIKRIILKHNPDVVSIEKLFFSKNVKTALRVGEARGVILLAAHEEKIPIREYTPIQVKLAVTGYGKADKKQIQQMVKVLLKLSEIPKPDDVADALAIAICHQNSYKLEEQTL